ncbi:MAG: P-II family nitrogen regulator [bacterium]
MKMIKAIIRPEKVAVVREALEAAGYPGIMVSEIEGHGRQRGLTQTYRGQEYKVAMLQKAKLELVVADKDADRLVKVIVDAAVTGNVGDGKIFVSEIAQAIRIRTGERGESAL